MQRRTLGTRSNKRINLMRQSDRFARSETRTGYAPDVDMRLPVNTLDL